MTFVSLASSSRGNCYIVDDGQTRLMLECGISFRRIRKEADLSSIRACLLSHEHKDHSRSVRELIASGVEVYASAGTAEALDCELISQVEDRERFRVGSFDVIPFRTWHDALLPLGYLLRSRADGEKLVFATDTVNLRYRFPGVNILALEANYDKGILSRCEMPYTVKERVKRSHMEIDTLCSYLETLDLSKCRKLYLLHLSRAASYGGDFLWRVRKVVPGHVEVEICEE